MNQQTDAKPTGNAVEAKRRSARRRLSILRSVIVLAVATIALFVFILGQGDARRRQRAMEQAQWHANTLSKRVGESGVLPLNLEPEPAPGRQTDMLESLSRQEARYLRQSDRRVIVAQTTPVLRVFAPAGRAVIFFQHGRFDVEWLTVAQFDELHAQQQDEIRRLEADSTPDRP